MGYNIQDVGSEILIHNTDTKDINYYSKSLLTVSARSGNIIISNNGSEIFNQEASKIDRPSVNGVYDLVTTIKGYINDIAEGGEILFGNVMVVEKLSDFPNPIAGIISLNDETIYQISGAVDIGSNRLLMGVNTTIRGKSPALDYITSSTTSALITATTNFRLVEVGFQASNGSIFSLNGSGAEICLMIGVRFFGSGGLGSVDGYDLFECNVALFVGFTIGLSFTGSNGSLILIDTEFFQTSGTPTSVNLNGGTWNLIRILGCSFVTVSGGTGLIVAANGANLNSGYIGVVSSSVFSGAGTAVSGYSSLDEEWAVNSTSVGIVTSDRIEPTGWAYYGDAETSPATQSLTTTYQKLQIDGGSTIDSYLPKAIRGTGTLWDVTNDKITPISIGDSYDLRVDLEITSSGGGASSLYLQLDIGGGATPSNVVVDRVIGFGKTPPFTVSVGFPIYCLNTFKANGGRFFIRTDAGTATLATRGIMVSRNSSGFS